MLLLDNPIICDFQSIKRFKSKPMQVWLALKTLILNVVLSTFSTWKPMRKNGMRIETAKGVSLPMYVCCLPICLRLVHVGTSCSVEWLRNHKWRTWQGWTDSFVFFNSNLHEFKGIGWNYKVEVYSFIHSALTTGTLQFCASSKSASTFSKSSSLAKYTNFRFQNFGSWHRVPYSILYSICKRQY